MHLDGARLWNAHVASGVPLADYGREFDTVSVCLCKGLGAPVGTVLVGSAGADGRGADLAQALRRRHAPGRDPRRGRAVRPRPPLERLADDHARARRFAEAAASGAGLVDPQRVETNIVDRSTSRARVDPGCLRRGGGRRGIRLYAVSATAVRLVWHLDVDDAGTDRGDRRLTPLLDGPRATSDLAMQQLGRPVLLG